MGTFVSRDIYVSLESSQWEIGSKRGILPPCMTCHCQIMDIFEKLFSEEKLLEDLSLFDPIWPRASAYTRGPFKV